MTNHAAALEADRMTTAEFTALKANAEAAAEAALRNAFVDLSAQVAAQIAAQPRVRILRGGYRGDLGRISGVGRSGGHIVTTDSGILLGMAEHDIERLTGKA
jgi:hypothetical protein